jgi:superfamily II DNA or RNA helicase
METPIQHSVEHRPAKIEESLRMTKVAELRREIAAIEAQKSEKEQELRQLQEEPESLLDFISRANRPSAVLRPEEKIALFLELFGARRDVYPKFWENPNSGKKGYSPAYANDRDTGVAGKRFLPLDEHVIEEHLRGHQAIGVYALRKDDSCIFLAADFDGDGWKDNVLAYKEAAQKSGVTAAIERSRSGDGAHAWIFLAEPVPAVLARRLGTILLAKASAVRPAMNLSAYDRLFPTQDTMPKGGFGNLIALPLAGKPRKMGNTVFLDDKLEPYPDQWTFLATVHRLRREDLDRIIGQITPMTALVPIGTDDIAFALESDECALDLSRPSIKAGMISGDITVRFDSRLHIPLTIPAAVLAALKRLATFANPVFHHKLRLRFATYDTPRFIFAGEWHPDRLVLPRGAMDDAVSILESAGANVTIQDARPDGSRVRWTFHGELRAEQKSAVEEMAKHDYGVLCAPPGAGKTVMGCALIARHRTSTLVLIHRTLLLDQWRKEVAKFLGITKRKEIGIWRGATRRLTRKLDIAMLPSLARVEDYAAFFQGYGLVVVDECHHVPAVTFEALLKACPTRKIVGLTATPVRKDGLEKLLYLQCGPIRQTIHAATDDVAPRTVYVRRSSFHVPNLLGQRPSIHAVWEALVADDGRARQIAGDISAALDKGRCPLVLSDRKAHLDKLEAELVMQNGLSDTAAIYRLESGVGKKQRQAIRDEIDRRFQEGGKFVLLATASLIGEGYDLPRLDTLFLAMPLSFKGRLIQYAGRLHRSHADKREIRVYDYLDEGNPLTMAMFRRRSSAYRQMGYRMVMDGDTAGASLDFG